MTLQECYQALDGDFADVSARLPSERLVQKFILKFLDDPSFQLLMASLQSGDVSEAFRASHTLKGVCQNLSLTRLYRSSHALTEALRGGSADGCEALARQVAADYRQTVDAIVAYRDSQG